MLALPVVLAVALRTYQLSRPGYLFGATIWDDGAYLGQTLRLLQGVLPYRDYAIVEPPGLTVLLAPVAASLSFLSTDGLLAAVRVLTNIVGVVDVVLIGVILRHKGRFVSAVAMSCAAIFPAALNVGVSLYLEPFLDLFCLLSVLWLFKAGEVRGGRGPFIAGLCLGIAGSIKIFAVFPLIAGMIVLGRKDRRALGRFLAGSATGFSLVCAPFALLAPSTFMRDAIYVQLVRSAPFRSHLGPRFASTDGLINIPMPYSTEVVIGAILLSIAALAVVHNRHRLQPQEVFCLISSLLVVGGLMFVAIFMIHYADFLLPFAFVGLAGVLPTRRPQGWMRWPVGLSVLFGLLILLTDVAAISNEPAPFTNAVPLRLPPHACVLSDSPVNLIVGDRFTVTTGCPVFVDTFGTTLAMPGAQSPASIEKGRDTRAVAAWEGRLGHADYLVWTNDWHELDLPVTPAFNQWLHRTFFLVGPLPGGGEVLYRHR